MLKLKTLKEPTIAKRILAWFLLISLVPVIFVAYTTYKTSEKRIKEETLKNLMDIAESKDVLFNEYMRGKETEVRELAFTPAIVDIAEKYHAAFHKGTDSREYISLARKHNKYFANFVGKFGYYDLFLIDIDGNVFFTVKRENDFGTNLHDGPYKDTGLGEVLRDAMKSEKAAVSEFRHYSPSNEPAAFIGAPITRGENIVGVIVLQLSNEEIYEEIQNYIGLGETGEIVIARKEGDEAVFIAPLRHDPEAAFKRRVAIGSKEALPIQKAVQEGSGSGLSVDYRDKEILAVWRYLPDLKWGMVIKIDTDEAYEHIYNIRKWAFSIAIATVLAVILIAIRLSRSISEPIMALNKGSIIIGSGNLDHKVGTDAKDEIGELSRRFDQMIENLKTVTASRDELNKEIAQRRRVEEALQKSHDELETRVEQRTADLVKTEKGLRQLLEEKEMLIKEIHHRVKNNLIVVTSLLRLQRSEIKDERTKGLFIESENRVKAMSMLHERLYRSVDISNINFSEYVRSLASQLFRSYKVNSSKVRLVTDVPDVSLDIDDMIPCGLIINELISNAFKYAFPEGKEGNLTVSFQEESGHNYVLIVKDNGVGLPENFDFGSIESFGMQIVQSLTEQLKGTLELNRKEGTEFRITFKGKHFNL